MSAINYPDSDLRSELSTEDRRTHDVDPARTPKRRIDDTMFNQLRWPAFLALWFVFGLAVLVYLFTTIGG